MAADFNPYHVWLGIPPDEQPANQYRLLGIRLFETSADVIDNAADRQMAHLRTIQVGKHGELSQRLLNEVAAARVRLLDPKKRAAYDQQLRAKLPATSAAAPATSAAPAAPGGSAIHRQPPRRAAPLPTAAAAPAPSVPAAAAPQPDDQWDDLLGDSTAKPAHRPGAKSVGAGAAKRAANNRNLSVGIAAAVVLVAAVGIGWFALNGSSADGTLVFDWPPADRANTTVAVDGTSLTIPPSGPWEYSCPAGPHQIVAQHLAFKLDANVAVVAGQKQAIPPDWKPKAMLVLNWPLAQRGGAELKVDGRIRFVSQHEPLELPVEPGRHQIQIARPGFARIVATANVVADGRELVSIAAPPTTAKLVFDWPADQRKDADLIVDGHSQTVMAGSDNAPIELTLQPGRHVVHITRTGFEPFNQAIDLAAGANQSVKPIWTPEPTVATTATDTAAPVEAAPEPMKKLPAPAAAEQERIAKQLDELYKTAHGSAKDPAKAQELYDVAAKAGASPAERYMLLMKGAEIAAAAGDLNLSLQGIDALDADYEIDALDAKQKLLDKFVNAGMPDQVEAAISTAEALMDQAVAADRYEVAIMLATTASHAAIKSKIATHKEIEDRLSRRRHDIHLLEPLYAAAKTAQETLDKQPADPEANLTVGRWLCFYKGDWSAGLPLLAKGSDEKLKALAAQDIAAPTDADQQVQLADAWWDVASKEAGIARDSVHLHAGDIYQAASPNLASALKKAAIEKRLAELVNLPRPAVATAPAKPAANARFPLGQWVDVLRLVDLTRDRVHGVWTRNGTEVTCEPGSVSRLAFPVTIDGGYDFDVGFTRTAGTDAVATIVPVGGHNCMATLSGWGGEASGLAKLNDREAKDPNNPTSVRPGRLDNGRRYRLLIRVRIRSTDRASIDVWLDGKPYLPHWEGDPAILSCYDNWALPNPRSLGFLATGSAVTIRSARLRMVSGQASLDRAVAESQPERAAPAVVSSKPSGSVRFPLGQWVDVLRMVDIDRDRVAGAWTRKGNDLTCDPGDFGRIAVPVVIDGSYDLEVEFTRSSGNEDLETMLSIGSHGFNVSLSGWVGSVSGLWRVDRRGVEDQQNPTTVRPGAIENGHRHRLLIGVRMLANNRGSVDVSLDGNRYLPHWEGDLAALSPAAGAWKMNGPQQLGFGSYRNRVTFHSARLRMVSGHASLDPAVAESEPPQLAPIPNLSDKPPVAPKFALGQWVDVLRFVDPNRDRVDGTWTSNGRELVGEVGKYSRISLPVDIDGGYDFEVEFTRTSGDGDIAAMLTVGSHGCMAGLSGWNARVSGLTDVDGRDADDSDNHYVVRPGTLENGHRYRLLISTRILGNDRASVDVALDGKRYLPRWEGNPSALSYNQHWRMPNSNQLGLGAQPGATFHSARLRMISGQAALSTDEKTERLGGGGGGEFEDHAPPGGLLVGFRIVTAGPVNQLQAIYRTRQGTIPGKNFGKNGGTEIKALAKDGYAVGAIVAKTGGAVDGFKAVFMRVRGAKLDPGDAYESEWLGGQGGGGETTLTGAGSRIVGVHGLCGDWIDALGLIVEKTSAEK